MMIQCGKQWELPVFRLVAGSTKTLYFPLYGHNGQVIDVQNMTGTLAMADYVNRNIVLNPMSCTVVEDEMLGAHVFTMTLDPDDTMNLQGRYIYQLTISTLEGVTTVLRGIVDIGGNIL